MRALFIHGAGRAGPDAWPRQAGSGWTDRALASVGVELLFAERHAPGDNPDAAVESYAGLLNGRPGHVVAHSYGALAAFRLAERHGAATLTLIEPATFALAAHAPATHAHIEAMASVYELAPDPNISHSEFAQRFSAAMGQPVPELPPEQLAAMGIHLRALRPPWSVEVGAAVTKLVPTLVVTGGGEPMYGEVAAALAARGAHHVEIPGTGHRPHDDERFNALLLRHWSAHGPSPRTQ